MASVKRKVVITCAVTGAIHTPSMSPHLPVTPDEIIAGALGAAEAGAAVLHLYDASERSLARIKQLGLIWGVQDGPYFGGERLQREVGVDAARKLPPIATALRMGLVVTAGTDAHRVSSYNPFVSLQWYLDGTTIGGTQTRGAEEAPSRRQALEMYTRNSAFEANEDDRRGTLEPGKFADLAVLSSDYMTVPVNDIGRIRSVLTMVGGNIVFADKPFTGFDTK